MPFIVWKLSDRGIIGYQIFHQQFRFDHHSLRHESGCQTGPYQWHRSPRRMMTPWLADQRQHWNTPTTIAAPLCKPSGVVPRQTGVICAFPSATGHPIGNNAGYGGTTIYDVQFVNCETGVYLEPPPPPAQRLFYNSSLFRNATTSFAIPSPPILICKT